MSIKRKETIPCPRCEQAQEFVVWESLNGDIDPEAKQQLLDGTLFQFECKGCGCKTTVCYKMLYHDITNQAMVYLVDTDSVDETQKTLNDAEAQLELKRLGYRKRIVTDQNTLREKALLFEHGLDDRIIEIIKLMYCSNARKRLSAANIHAMYFWVTDNKYILNFIGDQPFSAEVSIEQYEKIRCTFAKRLEADDSNALLIDMHWAANFLKS